MFVVGHAEVLWQWVRVGRAARAGWRAVQDFLGLPLVFFERRVRLRVQGGVPPGSFVGKSSTPTLVSVMDRMCRKRRLVEKPVPGRGRG